MMMRRAGQSRSRCARAQGFTLVEIMVGMVIGMIGMVVMMQVFLGADASKRSASGVGDAQTNGIGALDVLQRDLRQSGYGLTAASLVGCSLALRSGVTLGVLAPVQINAAQVPAGDPDTDTLLLAAAGSAGSPDGDPVISQPALSAYAVATPVSFAVGDWVVAQAASRPVPCRLVLEKVQSLSISPPLLSVPVGVAGMANGSVFNLGRVPRLLAYAVRGGNLTVCDFMAADCSDAGRVADPQVWSPLAANIVSLRAQYGRDTNPAAMDAIVDGFDQVTPGSSADTSGRPIDCAIYRVLAVRLALVARSGAPEKSVITASAPRWTGSADAPIVLGSLPGGAPNPLWQNFRYKVFETVVPLRNLLMLGANPRC